MKQSKVCFGFFSGWIQSKVSRYSMYLTSIQRMSHWMTPWVIHWINISIYHSLFNSPKKWKLDSFKIYTSQSECFPKAISILRCSSFSIYNKLINSKYFIFYSNILKQTYGLVKIFLVVLSLSLYHIDCIQFVSNSEKFSIKTNLYAM